MKNKFRIILPKLLAATVLLGIATLIIGTIFKLVLLATLASGIVAFVASRRRKKRTSESSENKAIFPYPMYAVYRQQQSAIVPMHHMSQENRKTIVPIY